VIRVSDSLVAAYNTYGFTRDGDFPEVTEGILKGDYPGNEFYIGGQIVKDMPEKKQDALKEKKVTMDRNAQRLIAIVTAKVLGKENDR
jgi:CRISPR-associated protein Cst2